MRTTLIACLILLSTLATGARINLDCTSTPVDAVLADIAAQSGESIVLAAPSDAKVTAKLAGVSVEEALKVVSGLCEGTYARSDSGYHVYPKTGPDHVLALMRAMYSRIEDIEVVIERKADTNVAGIQTLKSRSLWKSDGRYRYETEQISQRKLSKYLLVEDGEWRWMPRPETCSVERVKPQKPRTLSLVTSSSQHALPLLASIQPADLPNVTCTGAEQRNGRPVYVLEYDQAPFVDPYKAPETGQWAPPPGEPPMQPGSGSLWVTGRGLEMQYRFTRPTPSLGASVARELRCGVDAETGMLAFVTVVIPTETYEVDALDIREPAPGVFIPFDSRRSGSAPKPDSEPPRVELRINAGFDDSQFAYTPPPDSFISRYPMTLETIEAELKEKPDDPDLLFARARSTAGQDAEANAAAIRDYERAIAGKPKTRRCFLTTLLGLAANASPDAALKYIDEIRNTMPDDRPAAFAIARAYQTMGKDAEALQEFGKLCASTEKRSEAPLNETAALCTKIGDKVRAERLYLEVLAIGDANQCDQAAQRLQEMYTSDKRLEALRDPLEAATKRLPDASGLLARYGLLLSKLGEHDLAMQVFRRVATGKSANPVSQVLRELKTAKNYKGAKEIAGIYMSQVPKDPDPMPLPDAGQIFSELSEICIAERVSVPEAIKLYRETRKLSHAAPGRDWYASSARQTLRRIFSEMKVMPEALQVVSRMWRADKSDTDLAYLLIDLVAPSTYSSLGAGTESAVTVLKDMIAVWPEESALHAMLGEILVEQGDYPGALRAFRRGMDLSPNHPCFYTSMAEVYSRAKEHDKALDLLRRLLARAPANENFYAALGAGYANAGQWDNAVIQFLRADDLQQARPRPYQTNTLDALIRCYEKLGNTAEVEQCMIKKVDRASSGWQRVDATRTLALYYAKNGDIAKCVARLATVEELSQKQSPDYALSGVRGSLPKEHIKAITEGFAAAIASKPDLFFSRLLLAELYTDAQDFPAALRILDDLASRTWSDPRKLQRVQGVLSMNQNYGHLHMQVLERMIVLEPEKLWHSVSLASAYRVRGMKDKALALANGLMRYVRGESTPPENSGITLGQLASSIARLFRDLNMNEEAIGAYQYAIDLDPERASDYQSDIAYLYRQSGDLDAALAEYATIIRTAKDDWRKENALRDSARIYEQQQNKEEAVKCWKQILSASTQESIRQDAQRNIDRLTAPPPAPQGGSQ